MEAVTRPSVQSTVNIYRFRYTNTNSTFLFYMYLTNLYIYREEYLIELLQDYLFTLHIQG